MISLVHPIAGAEEKKAVSEVIDSRMLASGRWVTEFEQSCAKAWGTKFGIANANGTTSLHTALLAAGIRPGDKVLTTPFSFIATANSILFCGAQPVFADIDPETFNLDPQAAEAALRRHNNIKAVLVVHLFGTPARMDAFLSMQKKYRFVLLEDCAQAQGASFQGRTVGGFGKASAYSFYATKNMTTGEGGVVLTNDPNVDRLARRIINHGRTEHSVHAVLGYNFRLTNLAAAIGLVQLRKLESWNAIRRRNAAFLSDRLGDLAFLKTPVIPEGAEPVFHQYTVRVLAKLRARFMRHLTDNGVGCGVYYPYVMYDQPVYRKLGFRKGLCPAAELAAQEVVSLPVHPALKRNELETIVAAVRSFKE